MPMYIGFCCFGLTLASCHLDITGVCWSGWLYLDLPLLSLSYFRSPGRPVALTIADLLWDLHTEGSSEGQRSCWFVALAADLLGGLQTIGSSKEQSSCCPMLSCSGSWGVWSMASVSLCATEFQGGFQSFSCPISHRASGWSSDCCVGCPVALCTEELLERLQPVVS